MQLTFNIVQDDVVEAHCYIVQYNIRLYSAGYFNPEVSVKCNTNCVLKLTKTPGVKTLSFLLFLLLLLLLLSLLLLFDKAFVSYAGGSR